MTGCGAGALITSMTAGADCDGSPPTLIVPGSAASTKSSVEGSSRRAPDPTHGRGARANGHWARSPGRGVSDLIRGSYRSGRLAANRRGEPSANAPLRARAGGLCPFEKSPARCALERCLDEPGAGNHRRGRPASAPVTGGVRAAVGFGNPHTAYGGTMHTKVCTGSEALSRIGCAVSA